MKILRTMELNKSISIWKNKSTLTETSKSKSGSKSKSKKKASLSGKSPIFSRRFRISGRGFKKPDPDSDFDFDLDEKPRTTVQEAIA